MGIDTCLLGMLTSQVRNNEISLDEAMKRYWAVRERQPGRCHCCGVEIKEHVRPNMCTPCFKGLNDLGK